MAESERGRRGRAATEKAPAASGGRTTAGKRAPDPGGRAGAGRPAPAPGGRAASSRQLPPAVWLLSGPEAGRKSEFLDKLAGEIAARAGGALPERHRFHAFESRMSDVVLALSNGSLFSAHRLVIVSEAERITRKEEVETLIGYLASPAPDATLVLETEELAGQVDSRIARVIPQDCQKIFWELFESDKRGWISNFFRQRKIDLEPGVVDHVLDMVENNTRDMRAECERLALFFPSGSTIGLDQVEQYLYHSKEENVFTLFARLAQRDFAASIEVLEKILLSRGEEAEPTALAAGLLWQFRRLATFKRLLEVENYGLAEAFEKTNLKGKRNQQNYQAAARNFDRAELDAVLELLADLDTRFRSIKADLHGLLLQMAVYYITRRGGLGAWRLFG